MKGGQSLQNFENMIVEVNSKNSKETIKPNRKIDNSDIQQEKSDKKGRENNKKQELAVASQRSDSSTYCEIIKWNHNMKNVYLFFSKGVSLLAKETVREGCGI